MAREKSGTGLLLAAVTAVALTCLAPPAGAAEPAPLVVALSKAELIRLKTPARRVVVGNPAIADVQMETPTLLYVFGKTAGETSLHVLGDDDRPLLARPVVVTMPAARTVAVHVPGNEGPTLRAYSCIDTRCLRVSNPEAEGGSAGTAPPAGSPPSAGVPPVTVPVAPPADAAPPPALR